jgi:hypothetical protein
MIYESTVQVLGDASCFSQEIIRLEISQARTPIAEALDGGPAHRAFIEALPAEWRSDPDVEIFSRLLYLKAGWYPLGPHYHFDWGGQDAVDGKPVETMMVLFGEASQTEFIIGPLEHPESSREEEQSQRPSQRWNPRNPRGLGERNSWDEQVSAGLRAGTLRQWHLDPEKLILFDNRSLHRARPATKAGWRVLIRAIRGLAKREIVDHGRHVPLGGDMPSIDRGNGRGHLGRFTTCRNGFIPATAEERARYEPYRDGGRG